MHDSCVAVRRAACAAGCDDDDAPRRRSAPGRSPCVRGGVAQATPSTRSAMPSRRPTPSPSTVDAQLRRLRRPCGSRSSPAPRPTCSPRPTRRTWSQVVDGGATAESSDFAENQSSRSPCRRATTRASPAWPTSPTPTCSSACAPRRSRAASSAGRRWPTPGSPGHRHQRARRALAAHQDRGRRARRRHRLRDRRTVGRRCGRRHRHPGGRRTSIATYPIATLTDSGNPRRRRRASSPSSSPTRARPSWRPTGSTPQ